MGVSESASADDTWSFEPSIAQNFSYESNPIMLSSGQKALYGSVTQPQLAIKDVTSTTQFGATLGAAENLFNQSHYDSTDLHGNANLFEKVEQWSAGVTAQSDYDTTRTSELTTLNINTNGSVRHYGNALSPTIAYSPSSIDALSLTGSVADSRYDSNLLTNYHIYSLSPSYQHNFDPLNTGSLILNSQRYQADDANSSSIDTVGPSLQWTSLLTPTWTFKASVGAEEYRQVGFPGINTDWKLEAIYLVDFSYKNDKDMLDLQGGRALQPFVNGTETFLDSISLSDTYNLNSVFSTNMGVSYQFASNSDQEISTLKSYVSASVGLAYHITDKLDATTTYQYREQMLTRNGGEQNDNMVTVGLVFHPYATTAEGQKPSGYRM